MSAIAKAPPSLSDHIDVDAWTAPFWQAANEGRLVVARCGACGHFRMPPTPFCPECHSQALDWAEIAGKGVVYSYTLVSRAIVAGTEASIPYVPAIITLPEAGSVRLISNIVETPIDVIAVGKTVHLVWGRLPGGQALPQFRMDLSAAVETLSVND